MLVHNFERLIQYAFIFFERLLTRYQEVRVYLGIKFV